MLYEIQFFDLDEEMISTFHMLGNNFDEVHKDVPYYLDEILGEDNWEILKIAAMPHIVILNLEDYEGYEDNDHFKWEGNVPCPLCSVAHIELDRIINMDCPFCAEKIKLADNGWVNFECVKCQKTVYRKYLSRNKETGGWEYSKDVEDGCEESKDGDSGDSGDSVEEEEESID
jgi:hypothetical protein